MWTSAFLSIQGQVRTKKLYSRISDLCIFLNNCKSVPYIERAAHWHGNAEALLTAMLNVIPFSLTFHIYFAGVCGPGFSEGGVTSLADGTGRQ